MYKLKKFSHLTQFKEKNYFKPMCCIIISNKLQENKEFYNILKTTLISLQNEKNYISIYLINSDNFEDDKNTFSDLYKDKPYFLMFFRSIQYEFFNNPINEFIPNIVSKICSINDGYLSNISKAFTKEKQEVPIKHNDTSIKKHDDISIKKHDDISIKKHNKYNKNDEIVIKKPDKNDEVFIKKKENIIEDDNSSNNIEQYNESDISSSSSENETNDDIAIKRKILKEKQKLLNDINE